jgi:lipopolysaccharide/colanic/teichoic acid biosynthesis glycosyltransferase
MLYRTTAKRLLDVIVALVAVICALPLMAAIAVWVRVGVGHPVLFRHRRAGRGGRPFTLLKFRTMTDARDSDGCLLPDGARLTAAGRFLRASSLDELPELINVVRGEMSLVGPRPLLLEYLGRYSPVQARRHEVRPGITGLAQVSGRNALSWDDKFALDVEYVDKVSFLLDMRILAATVGCVLRRDGISPAGRATAPEFMGPKS